MLKCGYEVNREKHAIDSIAAMRLQPRQTPHVLGSMAGNCDVIGRASHRHITSLQQAAVGRQIKGPHGSAKCDNHAPDEAGSSFSAYFAGLVGHRTSIAQVYHLQQAVQQ